MCHNLILPIELSPSCEEFCHLLATCRCADRRKKDENAVAIIIVNGLVWCSLFAHCGTMYTRHWGQVFLSSGPVLFKVDFSSW